MPKNKTLLVIEDDPDIRELLGLLLRDYWTVLVAEHPEEARTLWETHEVDVILSDWDMPHGGGRVVLLSAPAPVVIHAANTLWHPRADVELIQNRAAGVLEKPAALEAMDKTLWQAYHAKK